MSKDNLRGITFIDIFFGKCVKKNLPISLIASDDLPITDAISYM